VSEDFATAHADSRCLVSGSIESPSLFRFGANGSPPGAAFEVKFLIPEALAREVETRLATRLAPDPHADPALDGAYRTTSLYTDTPGFDVYRRIGEYGKSKFRVRRYGTGDPLFLERKDKSGDRVHKSRIAIPSSELTTFSFRESQPHWTGAWFRYEIERRRLSPICRVSYDRIAYLGMTEGNTIRATFDRNVRGELASAWVVTPVAATAELFPGEVICEFKYRTAMPRLFKEVVETFGLQPTACSKYRRFVGATGVVRSNGAGAGGGAAHG